jgi:cytochrome P450
MESWSAAIHAAGSLEVDILDEMMKLSLVFIGLRLFGRDISAQVGELSGLMEKGQKYITHRTPLIDFSRREFKRNVQRVREILAPLAAAPEPESIAALLTQRGFDPAARMDHLVGLFAAGHETTAVALTWTFWLLAKHPSMQQRIRVEGDSFLRAALDESLRLYPPVPCFARRAIDDDVLEGFLIPKGSKLVLAQHVTHRLPEFWKDPHTFDPERFLPQRKSEICSHAFFPFGMGPRTCVASAMAMLECRVTLSLLLERFTFETTATEEPKPVAMISLRPDRQITLRVTATAKPASSSVPPAPSLLRTAPRRRTGRAVEESS